MGFVARYLARRIWWISLWGMRRPWIKRLQHRWMRRERAWNSFKRQNRWARKWGLPMITVAMNFLLLSMLITVCYLAATNLYESGAFEVKGGGDYIYK